MKKAILLTTIILLIVSGVLAGLFFITENEKAKQNATEPTNATESTVPVTEPLNINSIKLTAEKSSIEHGESVSIKTEVFPANAKNNVVNYKTSDGNIASVDSHGKITALTAGECDITAYSVADEKISNQIKIKVTDKRLEQINVLNNYLSNIPSFQTVSYGGGQSKGTVTLTDSKIIDVNDDGSYELFIKYNLQPGINLVDVVSVIDEKAVSAHIYTNFKTIYEKNYGDYTEDVYTDFNGKVYIKAVENSEGIRKTNKVTALYQIINGKLTSVTTLSGKQLREDAGFAIPFIDDAKFTIDSKECTEEEYLSALSEINHTYTLFEGYVSRTLQIEAGKFEKASPVVDLDEGYLNRITWESSKPKTAKVNNSGIVTGVANGKCEVKGTLALLDSSIGYAFVEIKDKSELLDNYLAANKDKTIKSSDSIVMALYASNLVDIDNDGMNELLMYYTGSGACQLDVVKASGETVNRTTGFYTKTDSKTICHLEIFKDNTTSQLKLCENYSSKSGTNKTIKVHFDDYEGKQFVKSSSNYKIQTSEDGSDETYYINDSKVDREVFDQSIGKYEKYSSWNLMNDNGEN